MCWEDVFVKGEDGVVPISGEDGWKKVGGIGVLLPLLESEMGLT